MSTEELFNRIKQKKSACLLFFVENIPESHSLFQFSHISQIQEFQNSLKRLENNLFWGTALGFFAAERSMYSRNILYRLTFFRSFSMSLVKFLVLPSFISSYFGLKRQLQFNPLLKKISDEYDLEDERFKRVFDEFVNSKPPRERRNLEIRLGVQGR